MRSSQQISWTEGLEEGEPQITAEKLAYSEEYHWADFQSFWGSPELLVSTSADTL